MSKYFIYYTRKKLRAVQKNFFVKIKRVNIPEMFVLINFFSNFCILCYAAAAFVDTIVPCRVHKTIVCSKCIFLLFTWDGFEQQIEISFILTEQSDE